MQMTLQDAIAPNKEYYAVYQITKSERLSKYATDLNFTVSKTIKGFVEENGMLKPYNKYATQGRKVKLTITIEFKNNTVTLTPLVNDEYTIATQDILINESQLKAVNKIINKAYKKSMDHMNGVALKALGLNRFTKYILKFI